MPPSDDRRRRADAVTAAVAGLAALALLLRFVGLGDRPFHWDEARVGYWTLRYLETGYLEYRPVAGGPFLYVVGRWTFALFGTGDAVARAPVALIGGLLPLSALLFRTRLRGDETVTFAGLLAVSPPLIYYSRFLRGDVPLAAFALVALGGAVRFADTDRRRYLYLSAGAGALALAASGFAVTYLACWAVAAALLFDHARLRRDSRDVIFDRLRRRAGALRDRSQAIARAFLLAFGVHVFFYAPRAGSATGPGLWKPTTFPSVLEATTSGAVRKFVGVRIDYRTRYGDGSHPLLDFLTAYADLLVAVSLPVLAFAIAAFVRDRYRPGAGPSTPVAFAGYWGLAGLLLFPLAAEQVAPWVLVHLVVPFLLPAAVGVALLARYARATVADRDAAGTAAASLLVVALLLQVGAVSAGAVYGPADASNRLAQYGQPADDLDPFVANASAAIAGDEGTDVVWVGERYYLANEKSAAVPPVPEEWGERLPLAWYVERLGAETDSVRSPGDLSGAPPVVVADPRHEAALTERLPDHESRTYRTALWNREVVVFVER